MRSWTAWGKSGDRNRLMVKRKAQRFPDHPQRWVIEPLMNEPTYSERAMFGARACYLYNRLMLLLCSRGAEPWQGLLVPTEREHQPSLLDELPDLVVHPVIGKWLYMREDLEAFDDTALKLVDLIMRDDPRMGVVPKSKK